MVRVWENGGRVLGAFADQSWSGPEEGTCARSTKAFTCLLRAGGGGGGDRERLGVKPNRVTRALYHYKECGPLWRGGLHIHAPRHWTGKIIYQPLASGGYLSGTADGRFNMVDWEVFQVMKNGK